MIRLDFQPASYTASIQDLIAPPRLAELGPGAPNEDVRLRLEALTDNVLFEGRSIVDAQMAASCRSGLWLYHDFLDASHEISQQIDTPTGSFWHAIMHRREGDYGNSKYWFRRVGRHPVYEPLGKAARALAADAIGRREPSPLSVSNEWDPMQFVDCCQRVAGSSSHEEALCRWVQHYEWQMLFDHCYRHAIAVTV